MRIGGLASGMDIDQIVGDLMKAERMKVDKLQQQKQVMEWQKADYRAINLQLRNLYNTTFDMKLSSSYMKYSAIGSMSDGSDFDKYFSVSPGAGAVPGDYTVKVEQMADYAKLESSKSITKPLIGKNLAELGLEGNQIKIAKGNNTFDITVDGVRKTITLPEEAYGEYGTGGQGLSKLADHMEKAINEAFGWNEESKNIKMEFNDETSSFSIQPAKNFNKVPIILNTIKDEEGNTVDDFLSSVGFEDGAAYRPVNPHASLNAQLGREGDISFKINGKDFEFAPSASLQTIIDKINTTPESGVRAHYDPLTDKFVLTSRETGQGAVIDMEDDSGLFKALGFDMKETNTISASGQNARMVLNGTIIEKTTNDFTVSGMRFNITKAMEEGEVATFRVENDPDAAVESIKEYIELYNETIDIINTKLLEERHRKYPPLTEDQKKEMSENDIKLWEEKAKSGLLRSDPLLDRIVRDLRSAISAPVAGLPQGINALSAIGITTQDWKEFGKLHIDENKLRDAIAKDPGAVMRIFNASGDDFNTQGVANRVYDILRGGVRDITDKAGGGEFQKYDDSHLGKQIRDMEKRIDEWEERLWRKEEHYWQQFTRMEQAIQYANQQSLWLMSQMNIYGG